MSTAETNQAIIDLAQSVADLTQAQQQQAQAMADLVEGLDTAGSVVAQALADARQHPTQEPGPMAAKVDAALAAMQATERIVQELAKAIHAMQSKPAPQITVAAKMQPPEPATWRIDIYAADGKTIERTARITREAK